VSVRIVGERYGDNDDLVGEVLIGEVPVFSATLEHKGWMLSSGLEADVVDEVLTEFARKLGT
jgi:hypothetical protein